MKIKTSLMGAYLSSVCLLGMTTLSSCEDAKELAESAGLSDQFAYSFSGKVETLKGDPIAGAKVDFIAIDSLDKLKAIGKSFDNGDKSLELDVDKIKGSEAKFTVETDAGGNYEISNIDIGIYFVRVTGPADASPSYDVAFKGFDNSGSPAKLRFDETLIGYGLAKKIESGSAPTADDLKFADFNFVLTGGPAPMPEPAPAPAPEPTPAAETTTETTTTETTTETSTETASTESTETEDAQGRRCVTDGTVPNPVELALTWENDTDMNLLVLQYKLSDVRANKTATTPIDLYSWQTPNGTGDGTKIMLKDETASKKETFIIKDASVYPDHCFIAGAQYFSGSVNETASLIAETFDAETKIIQKYDIPTGAWNNPPGVTGSPDQRILVLFGGDKDCTLLFSNTTPVESEDEELPPPTCE